jgi:hypothetical protein
MSDRFPARGGSAHYPPYFSIYELIQSVLKIKHINPYQNVRQNVFKTLGTRQIQSRIMRPTSCSNVPHTRGDARWREAIQSDVQFDRGSPSLLGMAKMTKPPIADAKMGNSHPRKRTLVQHDFCSEPIKSGSSKGWGGQMTSSVITRPTF